MKYNNHRRLVLTSLSIFASLLLSLFSTTLVAMVSNAVVNKYDKVDRQTFNRIAAELDTPLFWHDKKNIAGIATALQDQVITPQKLSTLWGRPDNKLTLWVKDGNFTERFSKTYEQIVTLAQNGYDETDLPINEQQRRKTVRAELAQGRPTLVATDLSTLTTSERTMVENILEAAVLIEDLYAKQTGSDEAVAAMSDADPASKMLFFRNQGPWCVAPATENDPNCHATPNTFAKVSGLYPKEIQHPGFCEQLATADNATELMNPFTVVKKASDKLVAVPYSAAYRADMQLISSKLQQAASAITDPNEAALKRYLQAAAAAFLDNNWLPADEAWASMNALNSKWYLRIGPDEVYYEPCNSKAGFHVSFAKINLDSLKWQEKLDPLKTDMEEAIAEKAGAPYQTHAVNFHLPDFIDIIINAGNSRSAHGGTIGQSQPNWGPVANEGRGRTVAMTNLYTDSDSKETIKIQAASLLCEDTMSTYRKGKEGVLTTVLHEAAHNLGPAHEYKVEGRTDRQVFGGPLASMLEELKAQTAASFYHDWLVSKNLLTPEQAKINHAQDLVWNFGHIAQGMYDGEHNAKPYSQLSAIQLGYMLDNGGVSWDAHEIAANGTDKGCFSIKTSQPEVIGKMLELTAGIKARGDKPLAEKIKDQYVESTSGEIAKLRKLIAERWLRAPKSSFIYSVG